jgi:hypothetical protein
VINPALTKMLGSGRDLEGVDTTVVAGARVYVRLCRPPDCRLTAAAAVDAR